MRINETTVLVGKKCVLVPYRKIHVEKYHEWLKDPKLQEQTASEPLSLEEEYSMQSSWHKRPRHSDQSSSFDSISSCKLYLELTFIILERHSTGEVLPSSIEEILTTCKMAGDVNLFLNEVEDESEDHESESVQSKSRLEAECEVMIAESSSRRKGIAKEALLLLIHYASSSPTPTPTPYSSNFNPDSSLPIDLDNFLAKISLENLASRELFKSLGFKEGKIREVWNEVEVRLKAVDGEEIRNAKPLAVLEWKLES